MGILDGILGSKRYKKCQQNEEGAIDCVSYRPQKDGKKVVTATIKAQLSPDCRANVTDIDGDSNDIAELEDYLGKHVRTRCNQPGTI